MEITPNYTTSHFCWPYHQKLCQLIVKKNVSHLYTGRCNSLAAEPATSRLQSNYLIEFLLELLLLYTDTSANTKHLYKMCTTWVQRLRRWSNIVQMLYSCFVFTGTAMIVSDLNTHSLLMYHQLATFSCPRAILDWTYREVRTCGWQIV